MTTAHPTPWVLYGTLGCHLCENAATLLTQLGDARAITWQVVDIADLPAAQMHLLATRIPVLQTDTHTIDWPFGLADVLRLL